MGSPHEDTKICVCVKNTIIITLKSQNRFLCCARDDQVTLWYHIMSQRDDFVWHRNKRLNDLSDDFRGYSVRLTLPQELQPGPLHHRHEMARWPAHHILLEERPALTFLLADDSVTGSCEGAWSGGVRALQMRCKRCIRGGCWCWCWCWCWGRENNFTPEAKLWNGARGLWWTLYLASNKQTWNCFR